MSDVTLQHMTNGQNISVANTNFDKIQDNINNHSLQKDGGNNILYQDLDLNGHSILNLAVSSNPNSPVPRSDLTNETNARISEDALLQDQIDSITSVGGSFLQAGSGAVIRTWTDKVRETVSVEDFGAVGDGVTDDTNAILLADTALALGGELRFGKNKTYAVNGSANISNAGVIDGQDSTLVLKGAGLVTGLPALTVGRVIQDTSVTPFGVVQDTNTFTLPAGLSVQVGDLLELRSSDVRVVASPDSYNHGKYAVVDSVVGSVVTLSSTFYASFNVNRIRVRRPPKSVVVKNLHFDVTNATAGNTVGTTGLAISAKNWLITGCTAFGNDYSGSGFICEGEGGIIESCEANHFLNIQGLPLPGRVGYGILFTGNKLQARNNTLKYCKHGLTTGSRDIVSSQLSFIDNKVYEDLVNTASTYGGSIDSHANVIDTVYIRGNSVWSRTASLSIRNGLAHAEGNNLYQLPGSTYQMVSAFEVAPVSIKLKENFLGMNPGARIFDQMQTSSGCFYIENNRINNGNIILTTTSAPTSTAEMHIIGNRHISCDRFVQLKMSSTSPFGSFTKLVIKDNTVVASSSASNANLLDILGDVAGNKSCLLDNVLISGNDIDMSPRGGTSTGYAISIQDCTMSNVRIIGNKIKRQDGITYSQRGLSILRADSTNLVIADNKFDTGIAFTNATTTMNCSALIKNNDFETFNFNDNDAANPLIAVDIKLIDNTIHNTQAITPIVFTSVSGSTAWSTAGPVYIQGNILQSSAANSINVSVNAVGHKISVLRNFMTGIYTDGTGLYTIAPFLNSTGTAQSYKGATTISYTEILKSSVPTAGTWSVGDRVRNSVPVVGQPKAWVCTAAGTPGTWVSEGNL